jgi:L-rhamnonate dehydratase
MKITDVATRLLRLPAPSVSGDNLQDLLVIQVHTDAGITGIGEVHSCPQAARAVIEAAGYHTSSRGLAEILVGEDPLEIGRLWDRMYSLTQSYGRRGLVIHAISGLDIALWDILGKATQRPVYQLIGSCRRKQVPAYASDLAPPTLRDTAEQARRHAAAGYRAIKIGWGPMGHDLTEDARRIETPRLAAYAELRGVRVIPHCWSSDIVMDQPLRRRPARQPIRPDCGIVSVPEQPGLGIELDEETMREYEVTW